MHPRDLHQAGFSRQAELGTRFFAQIWIGLGWAAAIGIALVCVWAIQKSLQSGFIGRHYFMIALTAWVVFAATIAGLYWQLPSTFEIPTVAIAVGIAGLLIPLASTAFAPLALAAHRNG